MATQLPYGVSDSASIQDLQAAFAAVYNDVLTLSAELTSLRQQLGAAQGGNGGSGGKKGLIERKGFERLGTFNGEEKGFSDWEFQLQQHIRTEVGFET